MELTRTDHSLRIEWSSAELDGLRNGFIALYGLAAAVALPIVLLVEPKALVAWAAFSVFLVLWSLRIRAVDIEPFVVEADADRFVRTWTGGIDQVRRGDAMSVRAGSTTSPRTGRISSVRFVAADGSTSLHLGLPRAARDALLVALAEFGWPVADRGRRAS